MLTFNLLVTKNEACGVNILDVKLLCSCYNVY